ncbi:type III secretion system co-regulatory protein PtrC [Pseudomonas sp. MT3]|uniref:type III secretion system co-regulatory protein PtrC n=1 Tax=Pseudomonas sp. ATCC 13867 TaxID=1294143 RepID=UPI001F3D7EB6|nr:type III secretion system co-regulatory protein PtrC [Pseudomonas sp. ATCC 13867]
MPSSGLRPSHIELPTMSRVDEAYRITYITLDELQLQFETEIAVTDEEGSLVLHRAATLPAERRALRELIRQEPPASAA